jgi:ankyrin repeat protein
MVDLLVDRRRRRQRANPDGDTILMAASRTGRVEVVDRLIAAGADVQAREAYRGETALMRAAGEGHAAVVTRLAKAKADLDVRFQAPRIPEHPRRLLDDGVHRDPARRVHALMFAAR